MLLVIVDKIHNMLIIVSILNKARLDTFFNLLAPVQTVHVERPCYVDEPSNVVQQLQLESIGMAFLAFIKNCDFLYTSVEFVLLVQNGLLLAKLA